MKARASFFKGSVFPGTMLAMVFALSLPSAAFAQQTGTTNSGTALPSQGNAASSPAAMPVNPSPGVIPAQGSMPVTANTPAASGINIPSPPPATAFSSDPAQIAAQAEQQALQAQAQAEADQARREKEYNEKSFNKAASGLMPLSPDQIRTFMHKLEQTQDAALSPYAGPPKSEVRVQTVSLDPGVQPPQINLASGYVTTINMVDATGEPWPILDVGVGGSFEVSPTPAGSHVVRVMPLTRVGDGNLSVLLKDLPTPVIFRLVSGGPAVDMRFDARVAKLGPGAKVPLIQHPRLEAGNENMMLILENLPPSAAQRMKISGVDARTKAWSMDSHVFVRTPLTLLSPAWNASVSSADGMTVYDIGDAPVLLMSDNGAMVRAQLVRDDDQHDKQ